MFYFILENSAGDKIASYANLKQQGIEGSKKAQNGSEKIVYSSERTLARSPVLPAAASLKKVGLIASLV